MVAFLVICAAGLLFCGLAGVIEMLPEKVADKILKFFPD